MNQLIAIHDKQFKPYLSGQKIAETVKKMAVKMNADLDKVNPLFLVVLNGSFVFAADLLREISFDCEISFVKLSSYAGTETRGKVTELIGLTESVTDRTVVIVEDIVDSGITMSCLIDDLKNKKAKEVKLATLLFKPESFKKNFKIDYVGFEVPNDFVVGYGMDYNGRGRNLKEIHVLA